MIRIPRPWVASACALWLGAATASAGGSESPSPFYSQAVESSPTESESHTAAWILISGGVALDVGSFVLAGKADDSYRAYQNGTDPSVLAHDYDQSVRYDRLASATLILGQVAIGTGLYFMFIRHPKSENLGLDDGGRVGVAYRPVSGGPGGLALTVRF